MFHCIGSDHVVDNSHDCKEPVCLGRVWYRIKCIEGFYHCTLSSVQIVGMSIEFLLVCYMKIDKQAGAKLSQVQLANYELC